MIFLEAVKPARHINSAKEWMNPKKNTMKLAVPDIMESFLEVAGAIRCILGFRASFVLTMPPTRIIKTLTELVSIEVNAPHQVS